MYIVKVYEEKHARVDWIPNLLDGFHEVKTLDEALEIRSYWLNNYPFLCNVKIYKSDEIVIDDDIRKQAMERKDEEYKTALALEMAGYDGYVVTDENNNRKVLL